ncbi:MAG TPA: hypothetical protein VHM00_03920 [Caldimonas sp.]|jgi:hypothetical protein|nr:hypothetical protein [Caldimonas sp.]HEX2540213.1 hypothetical protein [Caldimonas sp.]
MAAPDLGSAPGWPALLLAPLLATGHVSLAYALVSPSCARQDSLVLHALSALSLLLTAAMTAQAWRHWSAITASTEHRPGVTWSDGSDAGAQSGFIALVATLAGALSALVVVAAWIPMWVLPPCS